jgi:hypothetical protein
MRAIDLRTATDEEFAAWSAEFLAAVDDGSLRAEIDATIDPEWNAKYGDAAWETSLLLLGISSPTDDGPKKGATPELTKFNPYHDELGRFSDADSAVAGSVSKVMVGVTAKAEPALTAAVDAANAATHGEPAGREYLLKTKDSLTEKLTKESIERTEKARLDDPERAHDRSRLARRQGVRHGALHDDYPPEVFAASTAEHMDAMRAAGYVDDSVRNSWQSNEYRGINVVHRDPASEQRFEVQYHTPESYDTKMANHVDYAIQRDPARSMDDRAAATDRIVERTSAVEIPHNVDSIPSHGSLP